MDEDEALERARAALDVGDAAAARAVLERVSPTPDVLAAQGEASFVLLEFPRAIEEYERAYAGYRRAADGVGAVRVARKLGALYGSTAGEWAVASGWISRAKTLLNDLAPSSEQGWVALTEGMFELNRRVKEERFAFALQIGRDTQDADLEFGARAYLGASMVHDDRIEEGMTFLDEALAAVAGEEVKDFIIVEEIFCQLFAACEHARDVRRAEQWIRIGEQVAQRRQLPAVSAYCRTHYGGILTAAGRWSEADAALTEAVRLWAVGRRTLKADALVRLADLRVRQGRYDEAAALLEGPIGQEAMRPRAALLLARGEARVAKEMLAHEVERSDPGSSACIPLLGLLVDAQLACGDDATASIDAMAACADEHPSPYARALVALARGRDGQGDPKHWFRVALDLFQQAELPLETSLCRLDLAAACRQSDPEVAVVEARQALIELEKLEAARHVDAAAALLRDLGHKVAPPRPSGAMLTKREAEVLGLLGAGHTNPEIADRLFISRKTVEHHVGHIMVKLGLRNRAEAAAYAVRGEPGSR